MEKRHHHSNRLLSARPASTAAEQAPASPAARADGSRRSSLTMVKRSLMAPVVASRLAVGLSLKGTQAVANVTVKGTQAVANATTKTVVAGAKGVVGGGKALMDGTGAVVGYGGKTMVAGAMGVVHMTTAPWKSFTRSASSAAQSASQWEQGIACIEGLLHPESETYQAMNDEQRQQLKRFKKLLLKIDPAAPSSNLSSRATDAEKVAHIPLDLIQEQQKQRRNSNEATKASSNFILQEFAGVRNESVLENVGEGSSEDDDEASSTICDGDHDVDEGENDDPSVITEDTAPKLPKPSKAPTPKAAPAPKVRQPHVFQPSDLLYVPSEFTKLSTKKQHRLCEMLSWTSLANWGFDMFELNDVTRGQPLLFTSWAILGYPYTQRAMTEACGYSPEEIDENGDATPASHRYRFVDEFGLPPEKLCNYARAVQAEYHVENPYHNAIHAADVMQTLHALIQMKTKTLPSPVTPEEKDVLAATNGAAAATSNDPLDTLSILLAAMVHDMGHPGKTNGFQTNLRTELALMYHDTSVLENWHIARAFACMLGLTLEQARSQQYEVLMDAKDSDNGRSYSCNILCNVDKDDFDKIRNRMIDAVLHTDMTKHFAMVNAAKAMLLNATEDEKTAEDTWKVLVLMLHLADISGQAKPDPLFRRWTVRCADEFFDQGDLEAALGLPVSPNCDRGTTNVAESQTGFVKFVVGPAYDVLGGFIPALQWQVLPIIESNLNTWISES